jgi:PAS domain S-box-containing protein
MEIQELEPSSNVEQRYRLLVESIIDYAVYMLDSRGIVSSWNAGAQRFKGYASGEIIGSHFSMFYTEEDRLAGLPQHGLEMAASQGRFETEGWRVRNDGSRFWAHVIIDPIRNTDGTLTGFAKVTRDITERYESQLELDRAREALFQAQKMEAVGRLTGGVAHDFNNLMTIILISLNLAKKRDPESPVLDLIDNAIQGAERGAAMTQRMLAFSRRQPLQLEPLLVPEVVETVYSLIRQSVEPAVHVDTCFQQGLPPINGDRNQLETALLNLVFNARDAMPAGGNISIAVRAPNSDDSQDAGMDGGKYVLLEVVDDGEGMDAETARRAVEPFFTTKGTGKGTGLGLSMVHGIVEQFGGKLNLLSVPGSGTTVQLWLPVADPQTAAPSSGSVNRVGSAPCPAVGPLRVLVVDDDELVLTNTCALLQDIGHTTVSARSASEALCLLEPDSVDLVITDHAMPEMTGSELIDRIKHLAPDLPVVLASGYAEILEDRDEMRVTLAKPFDATSLKEAIGTAMRRDNF